MLEFAKEQGAKCEARAICSNLEHHAAHLRDRARYRNVEFRLSLEPPMLSASKSATTAARWTFCARLAACAFGAG